MKIVCAACGNVAHLPERVGYRDTCPSCDAWFHSCVHCALLVDSLCTEPSAEKVRDPEGQNYCDWFVPSTQDAARPSTGLGTGSTQQEKTDGSKEAAEEMWKKLTRK